MGLSPRVRGNLYLVNLSRRSTHGSIPARAGEPSAVRSRPRSHHQDGLSPRVRGNRSGVLSGLNAQAHAVYPRACGGTAAHWATPECTIKPGLSPRVRGNRPKPRPRFPVGASGLSPRVRGNPFHRPPYLCTLEGVARSIPARAGEPPKRLDWTVSWYLRVYPRACGGTGTA